VLGVVALAVAYLGWNASAWFTGSATKTVALEAGNLSVTLGAHGPDNRLSIAASHLVPGDYVFRAVTVTADGSVEADGATLTTEATTSSLLDTTPGVLEMLVVRCSVPVDETMHGGFPEYGCSGSLDLAQNWGPPIVDDLPLPGFDTTPGTPNYYVVALHFAAGDNNLQSASSVIEFTFEAQQRAGEYK
jgi:hypothetical protein